MPASTNKGPLIYLFMLLALWSASTLAFGLESVSLQLKWKHAFQFAGFYTAKEQGYYKTAGLDVEIREVSAETEITEEVLSGRATYGLSDSALVYTRLKGKPVVALAALFQHSPLALMTLKSSGISKPEHLRGKRVMRFGYTQTTSLVAMLASRGVSSNEFSNIPHSFNIDDLIHGNTDAYEVYTTDQPHQLKMQGIEYNLIDPMDYGFDFYGDILFTSSEEINQHSERTSRFHKASLKGWEYAFAHIDETIELILAKYNTQQLSKEHLQFEASVLKKISGIDSNSLGEINRGKIDFIASIYRLLGLSEKNTLDGFIYKEVVTHLTANEQTFIERHDFRAITTDKWAPFNLRNSSGELSGIAIDYWELIKNRTHINSRYLIANTWQEVLDSINGKTADLTISTGITEDRKKYALFSKPYASFPIALATTNDKGFISSASYLQGKKVAVGRGYSAHKILKQNYPEIQFIPADNITDALKLVSDGKAFAAAEILPVLAYKIGELGYTNIKISGTTKFNFDVRIMVRKEYPELISIINKGIESISEDEKRTIYNKWIAVNYQQETDYSLLWKIGLPLTLLLLTFYLWNIKLKKEISRREAAEKQLKHLATTDKLTNTNNRYKIEQLLDQQLRLFERYHRPFSITFLDLDDFKEINDTYGHTTGDKTLIEFTSLVKKHIRKSDLIGRWGGEEFLLILPETSMEQAKMLIKNLGSIIAGHSFDKIKKLTCSFGVAEITENDTFDSVMTRADKGLYKAKKLGKNRVETY